MHTFKINKNISLNNMEDERTDSSYKAVKNNINHYYYIEHSIKFISLMVSKYSKFGVETFTSITF